MKAITQGNSEIKIKETHSVPSSNTGFQDHRVPQKSQRRHRNPNNSKINQNFKFNYSGCFRCGGNHERQAPCPALNATCRFCRKKGHFLKACMMKNVKQLHEIVDSPDYEGQGIQLRPDDCAEFAVNNFTYEEDGPRDREAMMITVILSSVSTENALHSLDSHQNRIYRSWMMSAEWWVQREDVWRRHLHMDNQRSSDITHINWSTTLWQHHQTNSVAERAVGTCKSMWKKALGEKNCVIQRCGCTEPYPYHTMCHHRMSWCMDASLEYWYQVAATLYSQLMQTTSTTEPWTSHTRRNKLSTTTEKQVKLTGDLCTQVNLCTCTTLSQRHVTKVK